MASGVNNSLIPSWSKNLPWQDMAVKRALRRGDLLISHSGHRYRIHGLQHGSSLLSQREEGEVREKVKRMIGKKVRYDRKKKLLFKKNEHSVVEM